jgi:DNA-binding GntR family transcriptional regulator
VRAICAYRRILEAAAIQFSLTENPKGLTQALELIEARMRASLDVGDVRLYLDLDTEFHLAFFAFCGNAYLQNAYSLYSAKIAALRTHLAKIPNHTNYSFREHGEIASAVRDGNAAHVIEVLERHLRRTQETYEIGVEDISIARGRRPDTPSKASGARRARMTRTPTSARRPASTLRGS